MKDLKDRGGKIVTFNPVIEQGLVSFVQQHTTGFDNLIQSCRDASGAEIEEESGLTRAALHDVGEVYIAGEKVIGVYGMGLIQHTHGALNIAMLVNLLFRDTISKPGVGFCPVRGHSDVQGQRTVEIAEKVELVPLEKLKEKQGARSESVCASRHQ